MQDYIVDSTFVVLKGILLIGAAMTAIGLGIRRVYSMARGVEKIVEFTVIEKAEREKLAMDLKKHTEELADYRLEYNKQIGELVDTVREISRETRPNGGSSMKDVLNHTAEKVGDIHTRVAVLEEWKRNHEERA
jgi:hypothetical protein